MAASTSPVDGQQYFVEISEDTGTTWKALGYQQDANISVTGETREITAKNICYWREYAPSASSWTLGGTASIYTTGDTELTQVDVFDLINSSVLVKVTAVDCAGAPITGEVEYSGKGVLTELTMDFPDKDTATYSYSFQGSGELIEEIIV